MSLLNWRAKAFEFQTEMTNVSSEEIDLRMRRFIHFFVARPWLNIYTRYCCQGHFGDEEGDNPSAYLMMAGDPDNLVKLVDVINLANHRLAGLGFYKTSNLCWDLEVGPAVVGEHCENPDTKHIYTSWTLRSSTFGDERRQRVALDQLYAALNVVFIK